MHKSALEHREQPPLASGHSDDGRRSHAFRQECRIEPEPHEQGLPVIVQEAQHADRRKGENQQEASQEEVRLELQGHVLTDADTDGSAYAVKGNRNKGQDRIKTGQGLWPCISAASMYPARD